MLKVTVEKGSNQESYELSIDGHGRRWKITRNFQDFVRLKSELEEISLSRDNPVDLVNETEVLQSYIDESISSLDDRFWKTTPLLRFLDNIAEKSFIAELQLQYLSEQIEQLQKKTAELEKVQSKMQSSFAHFNDSLKGYGAVLHRGARHFSSRHSSSLDTPSKEDDDGHDNPNRESVVSHTTGDEDTTPNRSPIVSGEYSIFSSSNRNSAEIPEKRGSFTRPILPKSQYLDEELLPLGEKSKLFDGTIDNLLEIIGPTEQQMQHRLSVITLLRRLIRLGLGASVFEIGIGATRCILPDDPVRLMITLPKLIAATWHTQLCDYLSLYAERANAYGGSNFVPLEEDDHLDPFFNEATVLKNHFLGNITHMKYNLSHMVQLVIDSVTIEIVANNRTDLCFLGLFEEISNLVDNSYLFKRSFLLIRAWWCYETPSFVGCVIRHYLTDYQLFVMVAAIFNQFSLFISTPFQALCIFLLEYSTYDGNSQAITILGITHFLTKSSNQPVIPDIRPYFLIKSELLDKYWQIFNVTQVQEQEIPAIHKKRSTSSEDPVVLDGANRNDSSSGGADDLSASQIEHRCNIIDALKNLSASNLQLFDRSSFNIIHPLNHTNMITEKLSQRRVSRLSRAFQIGCTNLSFFLKRANDESVSLSSDSTDTIKTYFPNVANYSNYWTKQQHKEGSTKDVLCYGIPLPKIEADIRYADLMIEAIVSDQALLTLAMEILAMKGPLPVGEIGKILAEMTSIPSLSLRLKEKFGGLKKFLEQFPSQFVVSNDHPFNPNVLLRSSLSAEHLELVEKGIFPHQLLVKAKKNAQAMKKKKSYSIPQGHGENNSNRFEYHPYVQATTAAHHPSLPRHGQQQQQQQSYFVGGASGLSSLSSSKVSTPSTPAMNSSNKAGGGANNLSAAAMRRTSLSLNKAAPSFLSGNTSSPAATTASNLYNQTAGGGIASESNYPYIGGGSSDDLYGHTVYSTAESNSGHKSYPTNNDPYNNSSGSNIYSSRTYSPSPSVSQRNSINLGPSYGGGEDYAVAHDGAGYGSNAYLSQLRSESIDAQQSSLSSIGNNVSSNSYYQHDLMNTSRMEGFSSTYRNSPSPYSSSAPGNYPPAPPSVSNYSSQQQQHYQQQLQRAASEHHLSGSNNSNSNNNRSFSSNTASHSHHLANSSAVLSAGRGNSRQAGNYSAISSLLFSESTNNSPHNSGSGGSSGHQSSVLSSLFPSLLQPSDPPAAPGTPSFLNHENRGGGSSSNNNSGGYKYY